MAKQTTQRRFVLSIASASAVAAGCSSHQPLKHGLVANPHPDSGSPAADGGPVAYGLFPQPPVDGGTGLQMPDAADGGVQYHGVMVQPADSGPPQFYGVVARPMCVDGGPPEFLGVVIRPSDGGSPLTWCVPPDAGK